MQWSQYRVCWIILEGHRHFQCFKVNFKLFRFNYTNSKDLIKGWIFVWTKLAQVLHKLKRKTEMKNNNPRKNGPTQYSVSSFIFFNSLFVILKHIWLLLLVSAQDRIFDISRGQTCCISIPKLLRSYHLYV